VAASSFRAGDELILRGARFPAGALVLATFRQLPITFELGRFRASAAGDVTSEPRTLRVPVEAASGPAEISLSSPGASAACRLDLTAAPTRTLATESPRPVQDDTNPWLFVWATLVAICGGFLAFLTYRRWQADRLQRKMSASGHRREPRSRSGELSSPPVLAPGWDEGAEPIPSQRAPHDRGK
jgi:hypothetical protein